MCGSRIGVKRQHRSQTNKNLISKSGKLAEGDSNQSPKAIPNYADPVVPEDKASQGIPRSEHKRSHTKESHTVLRSGPETQIKEYSLISCLDRLTIESNNPLLCLALSLSLSLWIVTYLQPTLLFFCSHVGSTHEQQPRFSRFLLTYRTCNWVKKGGD